jgi:hypothetical protein
MNDALLVRRFERLGDLPRDRDGFVEGNRTLCDAIRERRPLNQSRPRSILKSRYA